MRFVLWSVLSLAAFGACAGHAQDAATPPSAVETPDEVVVRGKRLADFRLEVEGARERAYAIFNEINSTDDFDIECAEQPRKGSRIGRTVCGAKFEGRIARAAASEYLFMLRALCPDEGGLTQRCMFDPGLASRAMAAARGKESELPMQRDRLDEEIDRLARTDLQFGQALLDFYDASVRYEEERNRPRERIREQ